MGFYTLTLADGNNCMTTLDFEITSPDPITITQTTINHLSRLDSYDLTISVEVDGESLIIFGLYNRSYVGRILETPNFHQYLNAAENPKIISKMRNAKPCKFVHLLE